MPPVAVGWTFRPSSTARSDHASADGIDDCVWATAWSAVTKLPVDACGLGVPTVHVAGVVDAGCGWQPSGSEFGSEHGGRGEVRSIVNCQVWSLTLLAKSVNSTSIVCGPFPSAAVLT